MFDLVLLFYVMILLLSCVIVPVNSLVLFFFFFFKQKTAYEMRISDWSSDVCSSDLRYFDGLVFNDAAGFPGIGVRGCFNSHRTLMRRCADNGRPMLEIGRASCRERVCQYV